MFGKVKLFVMLAFLVGCATSTPITDWDEKTDFSKYKTFAYISEHPLLKGPGAVATSPTLEGRLMSITENVLSARGFRRVSDPEEADIAVAFTLGSREKIRVDSYPEPYRAGYGRWGWGHSYYAGSRYGGMNQTTVRQYTEGELAIDIYDVAERRPIWHGLAVKKITKKVRENPRKVINEIIPAILATFPPN